jgi:Tfp pilus assembly protein FimV
VEPESDPQSDLKAAFELANKQWNDDFEATFGSAKKPVSTTKWTISKEEDEDEAEKKDEDEATKQPPVQIKTHRGPSTHVSNYKFGTRARSLTYRSF